MAELVEDSEKVIEKISAGSGKSKEEIKEIIEERKRKFSGLLTDSSAALMVARGLGVDLNTESKKTEQLTIAKLEPGMNNVDIIVKAMHIFSPKRFEKENRKGVLCSVIVADNSGETRLTVWDKAISRLEEEGVRRGDVLFLKNCYVTEFNEKKQLNLGFNGQIIVNNKSTADLPKPKSRLLKLQELKKGMENVDAFGRVVRIYEEREFNVEGRKGKVLNFELADETSAVRAVAWNDIVDSVTNLNPGDLVKVEGAYTKEGLNGVELHLGWQARIIKNPKGIEISSVRAELNRKNIRELQPSSSGEIKATIVDLYRGKLHYLVCPKCRKKLEKFEEGYVCRACGEVKEPDINLVVNLQLDDGSASIRTVFFGKSAEKVIGINKDRLKNMLKVKKPEEIIEVVKPAIIGNEILVEGTARTNSNTQEMEFIARVVYPVEYKREAEKLIKEIC